MSRRSRKRLIPEVSFDPWYSDAEAPALRHMLELGDVSGFSQTYARADGHRREFLVHTVITDQPLGVIEDWPEHEPGSALAFLLRGRQRTTQAWATRGSGRAHTVAAESWDHFFDGLREAEADLRRSVELHDDGIAWSQLLTTGRGLQLSLDEQWARYCRAVAAVTGLGFAADQILQSLCAKWAGSNEHMFEFARSTSSASPDGSPLHRLIAVAHYERLLDFRDDVESADRYAADPHVHHELISAAQRSVFSPAFASTPGHVLTFNWFAFVMDLFGRHDASRPLLERIGHLPASYPWNYFEPPSVHFQDARLRAGLPPV